MGKKQLRDTICSLCSFMEWWYSERKRKIDYVWIVKNIFWIYKTEYKDIENSN